MTWCPIAGIVHRQFYRLRGSPVSGTGVDFVPTLLGVLLWDFCTRIMQGASTAFLEDVWSRNFLKLFGSPLSLGGLLIVLFVFGITLGILGSALVLRFGPASAWLLWPLPALLSPFAAVFYPLAVLPQWMNGWRTPSRLPMCSKACAVSSAGMAFQFRCSGRGRPSRRWNS